MCWVSGAAEQFLEVPASEQRKLPQTLVKSAPGRRVKEAHLCFVSVNK
jgi:hypothetical protein